MLRVILLVTVDKAAALGRTALFGKLKREDLAELARLARERELAPGEVLFLLENPRQEYL